MKHNMTTICYIEKDGCYLLIHRVKKEKDFNQGKWIGVGGHFEPGESPEDCLLREVREETGLTLISWKMRGIVTYLYDHYEPEYMFIYTADAYTGTLTECDEGDLAWVEKAKVDELPIWEGDRIFLRLLETRTDFFSLKFRYEGERLIEAVMDGQEICQLCPDRTVTPKGKNSNRY